MSYRIPSGIKSKPKVGGGKKITNVYWDDDAKEIVVEYES